MLRGSFRYLSALARIRAKEAKLLTPEWFDQLAGLDSLDEISALLAGTEYGPYLENESAVNLFRIETGLISRRLDLEKELFPILPREARELLTSLLRRWDVRNLKTLARGKLHRITTEILSEYMIPAGLLKEHTWNVLLEQNNLEEIRMGLAGTEYWPELESLNLAPGISSLPEFETALERIYWRLLVQTVNQSYLRTAQTHFLAQIQGRDLLLLMQARIDGISLGQVREWLIFPESLKPGVFRAYEAELGPGTISEMLNDTVFTALENEINIGDKGGTMSLSPLEMAMNRKLNNLAQDLSRGHPYGFPPVWAYLWQQETESRNILKVAKAKEAKLGKEDTKKLMEKSA